MQNQTTTKELTLSDILDAVSEASQVDKQIILGNRRFREASDARCLCVVLVKVLLKWPDGRNGRVFNIHRTSVIRAVQKFGHMSKQEHEPIYDWAKKLEAKFGIDLIEKQNV